MKKLFSNTIFKATFVLTCVALGCALLIALVNLVAAPAIAEGQRQREVASYKRVFSDMEEYETLYMDELLADTAVWPSGVSKKVIKASKGDSELVGYIYTVLKSNSYGNIKLIIGIGADKKIGNYIEILENGQTSGRNAQVVKQVVEFYGVDYRELNSVQNVGANATRAFETITEIMLAAGEAFEVTVENDGSGSDDTITEIDESFTKITEGTVEIQAKYNVKKENELIGYVYEVVNQAVYQEGSEEQKKVAFSITVDKEMNITGYHIFKTETDASVDGDYYEHTKGNRIKTVEQFMDGMIGKALSVVAGYGTTDFINGTGNASATLSQTAVLDAIKVLYNKVGGGE
ncbi:hypothetical protein LJC17_03390 [Acholeplasma sp. OttesenSCG-928-E16]|nr:hypothetical protein [Acholeplasma sp. OttesenSCG-928-E16]